MKFLSMHKASPVGQWRGVWLRQISKKTYLDTRWTFDKKMPVMKYGYWQIRPGDRYHAILTRELR